MWVFRCCSAYWLWSKASFSQRIWSPWAISRKGFRDLWCDANGLQLPMMPRPVCQASVHLAGKCKPKVNDLQDLLALWLVCSQGCDGSPALLQGLSTYFLLKTKYTESTQHGVEFKALPVPSQAHLGAFPLQSWAAAWQERKEGRERGRKGRRFLCSAMKESKGWSGNWIQGHCGGWLGPECLQRDKNRITTKRSLGWVMGSADFLHFRLSSENEPFAYKAQ